MDCPNYKTIGIPACFAGNLIIKTGLTEGAVVYGHLKGMFTGARFSSVVADGNIEISGQNFQNSGISFFDPGVLTLADEDSNDVQLFGFEGYKIRPYKNTDSIQDITITENQTVITTPIIP